MTTATATFTIACAAETRGHTGCARTIGHNGHHVNAAEVAHYGNAHAADTAIYGAPATGIWAAIATFIIS